MNKKIILNWAKDPNGKKNQSSNLKFDTCDRLGVLLSKSILFNYISSMYYLDNNVTQESRISYNEDSKSFINLIYKSLLEEYKSLLTCNTVELDSNLHPCVVPKYVILDDKLEILKLVGALLEVSNAPVSFDLIKYIEYYDFGIASGFLKEWTRFKLAATLQNNTEEKDVVIYSSTSFNIPLVYRLGYDITFNFTECLCGEVTYRKVTYVDPMAFMSVVNIPDANSDVYLRLIGNLYIGNDMRMNNKCLYELLHIVFVSNVNLDIAYNELSDLNEKEIKELLQSCYRSILEFLKTKHVNSTLKIGKITSGILNRMDIKNIEYYNEILSLFLHKKDVAFEQLSDIDGGRYCKYLDPTSMFFVEPDNIWAAKEDEKKKAKDSDEEEDDSKEETPKEEEPKEEETEEKETKEESEDTSEEKESKEETTSEETTEEEPSEDTAVPEDDESDTGEEGEGGEETPEEENEPNEEVDLKKGEYSLTIIDPTTVKLDEHLYRKEMAILISRVLENPPDNMSENNKLFLSEFYRQWLYLISVEDIHRILENFLDNLPEVVD
jgi:hypothetical protein